MSLPLNVWDAGGALRGDGNERIPYYTRKKNDRIISRNKKSGMTFFVIPAKAGIQWFSTRTGFPRSRE
jgi:hypothetical protein